MRNNLSCIIILFFISSFAMGQEGNWKLIHEYQAEDIYAWDVDPMGKVIFAQRDAITKLDSSFQIQFTQSVKGFGSISKIDARHSLKTLIFSEEQQSIAFMDNTLTFKDAKDLSLIDVSFATHASYSAQTSRYWVFDGDNSKLVMHDDTRNKTQVMENLSGTLGFLNLDELFEIENILLLFDQAKGIYLFDIYGTLIDFFETKEAKAIHYADGNLFYATSTELVRINADHRVETRIKLPEITIKNFRVLGNYVFFETDMGLKKYLLKNSE
jgi:hypothetical protein